MSNETQHFERAPIVEAIVGIDLQEMLGDDSQPILKALGDQLQPAYPSREDIVLGQFKFEIGSGSQPKQEDIQLGYFFKSTDRLQVVQARKNGFGFSRLAPYQDWESVHFRGEKNLVFISAGDRSIEDRKMDNPVHQ